MSQYAYIRVSTKEQNIDRQLAALKEYDLPEKHIFCDYQSGRDFNRPAYQRMAKALKPGDLVIIKSIDRLGRNYEEILTQWRLITKEKHADILVLDMQLLDTRSKDGTLTGTLIADLVLQILAYVAQTERDYIRQRQSEGIAAAMAKGKKFGRKPKTLPREFEEICRKCADGKLSIRQASSVLHMSHSTFYRHYYLFMKNSVPNCRNFDTNKGA